MLLRILLISVSTSIGIGMLLWKILDLDNYPSKALPILGIIIGIMIVLDIRMRKAESRK